MIHTIFDLLAAVTSFSVTAFCYQWRLKDAAARIEHAGARFERDLKHVGCSLVELAFHYPVPKVYDRDVHAT